MVSYLNLPCNLVASQHRPHHRTNRRIGRRCDSQYDSHTGGMDAVSAELLLQFTGCAATQADGRRPTHWWGHFC